MILQRVPCNKIIAYLGPGSKPLPSEPLGSVPTQTLGDEDLEADIGLNTERRYWGGCHGNRGLRFQPSLPLLVTTLASLVTVTLLLNWLA